MIYFYCLGKSKKGNLSAFRKGGKVLELKNIKKFYHTKAGTVNALDGVSLTLPSSGLIFILGKSGSGKTTLLNIIGGLDGIDEGEICVQDKNFSAFSAKEYDSYRNTVVGFIFQEYNLLSEYTVEYNIKIAMELQGVPTDEERVDTLLKEFEIENLRNRKPAELSGGQRQRVAIARALVKSPHIIMADEPTGALDSVTGTQVFDTLKRLSRDKLVIVVSHDNEFAEKYADRIIRLVDGKIVEDVSFNEKELHTNVSEREDAVIIKEGADLSFEEKELLAKAVKQRKHIEVTEKLSFRDKAKTGEVVTENTQPITFKKSSMKLKTSAYLGWKSVMVKPVRLLITVLISAFAFAAFGLFSSVANFTVRKGLLNRLNETPSTMVATVNYIGEGSLEEKYNLKLSDGALENLAQETGGTVKGIFDFRDNLTGRLSYTQTIGELTETGLIVGKKYFTNSINGFIEFDDFKEINADGTFKDFDYSVVAGEYPRLQFDEEGRVIEESLQTVAISTYLADSIVYYLNGRPLDGEYIENAESLLGHHISIGDKKYTIVGLIDCGEIPSKYDPIQYSATRNEQLNALVDDFNVFINSGAQKCLFVADGFRNAVNKKTNSADVFYAGDTDRMLSVSNVAVKKPLTDYVYNSEHYDEKNILLFNGTYSADGKVGLADDEVLVNCLNLEAVFTKKIAMLYSDVDKQSVRSIFRSFEKGSMDIVRAGFNETLQILGKTAVEPFTATISTKADETVSKQVKIVGFYFGVDGNNTSSASEFTLMINSSLMQALSIYPEQGDYAKVLFSRQSIQKGTENIVQYLTSEEEISFVWYQNSVLTIIQENEPIIRQAADLFLYLSLALAGFSIFMLYNYISVSITSKCHSVGVLRALGAGSKDILLTFLFESLLIGFINGILANMLCVLGCNLVNAYIMGTMHIPVAFVIFEWQQVLILFGLSILTSVISSVLPIVKISKKKPVELIR